MAHQAAEWKDFFGTQLENYPVREKEIRDAGIEFHWSSFQRPAGDAAEVGTFDLIFFHTVFHDLYDMKVRRLSISFLWFTKLFEE